MLANRDIPGTRLRLYLVKPVEVVLVPLGLVDLNVYEMVRTCLRLDGVVDHEVWAGSIDINFVPTTLIEPLVPQLRIILNFW